MKQIAGTLDENDVLHPEVAVKGSGHIYCYQPYERSFTKVTRNQKAYVLDYEVDHLDRVLIYTMSGKLVRISTDDLIFTGYD